MSAATSDAKPTIGFAGLGNMGQAMSANLVKAGYSVKVYNRTHHKTDALQELGATAVRTPTDLGDVDVLFTILNDAHALDDFLLENGVLEALSKAADARSVKPIHVSCATLPVDYVQELVKKHEARGVEYVAMPVLGRPTAAAEAKIHLLCAGETSAVERVKSIAYPTLGQTFHTFGTEPHKANVMKITFNMTQILAIESMAQGAVLVQRYGIPSSDYTSLLSETLFDCTAYRGYGDLISKREFLPAHASLTGIGLKDISLALKAGGEACVPLPFASVARDHLLGGIANGVGDWDWSAIAVVAEQHAGITSTPAPRPRSDSEGDDGDNY